MIKKLLKIIIPKYYIKQVRTFLLLSRDYGQFKSMKKWDCIDAKGKAIPWYTYPSIEYLNNIDFSKKSILEYGSGNSSIYWANKSLEVVSIEHDKEWYEKIKEEIHSNQELILRQNNDTYEKIFGHDSNRKFNVIIIDGIRRAECAAVIEEYLDKDSEKGFMVILDNSDWYKNTAKYLREELDLLEIDFHGFGPINSYTWTTSIFLSRNFDFRPIDNVQPNNSNSAIIHCAD